MAAVGPRAKLNLCDVAAVLGKDVAHFCLRRLIQDEAPDVADRAKLLLAGGERIGERFRFSGEPEVIAERTWEACTASLLVGRDLSGVEPVCEWGIGVGEEEEGGELFERPGSVTEPEDDDDFFAALANEAPTRQTDDIPEEDGEDDDIFS